MSIKAAIIEKNEGEEVEKTEYTNLILDDMEIKEICVEDRDFVECQFLSLNSTKLDSLENMPKLVRLERLELCENLLSGATLGETIAQLYPNLVTIKLSSNKIEDVGDIAGLKALSKLESLDLSDNPLCATLGSNYQAKVREAVGDKLEILDCLNKAGDEVVSDEDESDMEDDEADAQSDADEDEEEEGGEEAEANEQVDGAAQPEAKGKPVEEETEEATDGSALKRAKTTDEAPDVPVTAEAV